MSRLTHVFYIYLGFNDFAGYIYICMILMVGDIKQLSLLFTDLIFSVVFTYEWCKQ